MSTATEHPTPPQRLLRCLPQSASAAEATTLISSLSMDSLDTVEFLCAVHEEFGVRLTTDDFPPDQTVAGLLARIHCRLPEPQSAN